MGYGNRIGELCGIVCYARILGSLLLQSEGGILPHSSTRKALCGRRRYGAMTFGDFIVLAIVVGVVAVLALGRKQVGAWIKDKMTFWRK